MAAVKEDGEGIGNVLQKSAASAKKVTKKSEQRVYMEKLQWQIKGLKGGYSAGEVLPVKKTRESVIKAKEDLSRKQANEKRPFYTSCKLTRPDTTGEWNWVNQQPPLKCAGDTPTIALKNPLPHGNPRKEHAYYLNNSSHQQLDDKTGRPQIELLLKSYSSNISASPRTEKRYFASRTCPTQTSEIAGKIGFENRHKSLQRWKSQSQLP
eukprot:TRINITY_DN27664_c0_g1_i1.p1 TRINITY_DN27664_c0_g1~~TRINITY_DN27664_c0_g1_i1.p1  ORF type:complete len:209 (+),score=27.27 TRINITY_DN27664_c0_g1_i1:40-666(+)